MSFIPLLDTISVLKCSLCSHLMLRGVSLASSDCSNLLSYKVGLLYIVGLDHKLADMLHVCNLREGIISLSVISALSDPGWLKWILQVHGHAVYCQGHRTPYGHTSRGCCLGWAGWRALQSPLSMTSLFSIIPSLSSIPYLPSSLNLSVFLFYPGCPKLFLAQLLEISLQTAKLNTCVIQHRLSFFET